MTGSDRPIIIMVVSMAILAGCVDPAGRLADGTSDGSFDLYGEGRMKESLPVIMFNGTAQWFSYVVVGPGRLQVNATHVSVDDHGLILAALPVNTTGNAYDEPGWTTQHSNYAEYPEVLPEPQGEPSRRVDLIIPDGETWVVAVGASNRFEASMATNATIVSNHQGTFERFLFFGTVKQIPMVGVTVKGNVTSFTLNSTGHLLAEALSDRGPIRYVGPNGGGEMPQRAQVYEGVAVGVFVGLAYAQGQLDEACAAKGEYRVEFPQLARITEMRAYAMTGLCA